MPANEVDWRVNKEIYRRYCEYLDFIDELPTQDCEEYWIYVEDIKSLPGFPTNYNWRTDTVNVIVVDSPQVGKYV
jgi:hypothetical protein